MDEATERHVGDERSGRPAPVVGLLLAAGESTRMGQSKPLLPWNGATLIEYQVRQLLAGGCDAVVAVLGHRAAEVRPYAVRVGARVTVNAAYREGRAGSIRAGAQALPPETGDVVILNVDQPRPAAVTHALIDAHIRAGNLITVPVYAGKRGHPAVLAGRLIPELLQVDEATEGLRAVMQRHAGDRVELALDDPAVLLDLNFPADYEAARATQRLA
jgi:molybdenum cofactor cytidylyltransferase